MNVLAVIPARGGSKGIPRKNVRLMNGKPLIAYSICNAKNCPAVTDVVVSSDDDEILSIGKKYGAYPLRRSESLAKDAVTLDPVIYDATLQMEKKRGIMYDIVITLQPTSPLLTSETLNGAINSFFESEFDTYISATNQPHLAWSKNENGFFPLYKARLNRQQLEPNYLEAGAFFISKREFVTENSRIGKNVSVYEIPAQEAVDIDTINDWLICEKFLKRKRIAIRVDGTLETGIERVRHSLTLAYNLFGHDVVFVTRKDCLWGCELIKASNFPVKIISSDSEFFSFLGEQKFDIVINNCLDTEAKYIKTLKKLCGRVVTIDDLGDGAMYADVVINALCGNENDNKNVYTGEKYVCLRDEFVIAEPKEFSEKVKNVLVLFGGTDSSNLTQKVYATACKLHDAYPDIVFNFISGIGYDCDANGVVTDRDKNIFVYDNVNFVSEYMEKADLAFTSQGRTVFELATLGVPAIVLAQNEREQMQSFAQMKNGFFNLGLGENVTAETLEKAFELLVDTAQIRYEMRSSMLNHNFRDGIKNEINLIIEK